MSRNTKITKHTKEEHTKEEHQEAVNPSWADQPFVAFVIFVFLPYELPI